jgi:hypothetical protein
MWETSRWLLYTQNRLLTMHYQRNLPQRRRPNRKRNHSPTSCWYTERRGVGHGGHAWPACTAAKSRHGGQIAHRQWWGWWFDVDADPGAEDFYTKLGPRVARSGNARWEATRTGRKLIDSIPDWPNGEPSALAMPSERQIWDAEIAILATRMKSLLERWTLTTIASFTYFRCFEESRGDALSKYMDVACHQGRS